MLETWKLITKKSFPNQSLKTDPSRVYSSGNGWKKFYTKLKSKPNQSHKKLEIGKEDKRGWSELLLTCECSFLCLEKKTHQTSIRKKNVQEEEVGNFLHHRYCMLIMIFVFASCNLLSTLIQVNRMQRSTIQSRTNLFNNSLHILHPIHKVVNVCTHYLPCSSMWQRSKDNGSLLYALSWIMIMYSIKWTILCLSLYS